MICFMFPGQPLTRDAILPDDADFAELAALTRARTGLELTDCTWSGEGSSEQVALQVYGVAMSLYRHRRLTSEGIQPAVIAEHSMGIYAALSACGSVAEGDALELAFRLGVCMEQRFRDREYALGCVVGLTVQPLESICANNGIYMANFNTSRHFLLSGPRTGIEAACEEAARAGAFSAGVFPCDAPLHTPLMEEIDTGLRAITRDYDYGEPSIPLMEHIGQQYLTAAAIPAFLCEELCRPVFWDKTYRTLRTQGVRRFQEVGVGAALSKFNRWTDSES